MSKLIEKSVSQPSSQSDSGLRSQPSSLSSIPYGKQNITQNDIDAVVEVLKSDFLTQGPKVQEFEEKFSDYVGSEYAVAVANGTAALHLCVLALGVKPGDKVITTPITFAASANCILYAGGEVLFSDIDRETYLLDIERVEEVLEREGNVKGIIPVDFAGYPVNMEAYRRLADKYGLWVIEDACHAPGGYFVDSAGGKQYCGNGKYADLSIFSFHPVKHIATGEGGMVTTNSKELYEKLKLLRTHGIHKNQTNFQNSICLAEGFHQPSTIDHKPSTTYPDWYYEMQKLGYNYRMSDIHAALGVSQLERVNENLKRRSEIATKYYQPFEAIPEVTVHEPDPEKAGHAYHLFVIECENRRGLYEYLRKNGIYAQVHYIPIHLQPYYLQLGWKPGDFPNAEAFYQRALSIPMYHAMTDDDQNIVIETIKEFYHE